MSAATTRQVVPSERMVEHALRLIATAAIAPDDEAALAREQLQQWVARSERHAKAHAEAMRRWNLLNQIGPGLRTQFSEPPSRRPSPGVFRVATLMQPSRRGFLMLAGAALLGGAVLWNWRLGQRESSRRYRTLVAQSRMIELDDGSQLHLDADSEILVDMYPNRREVFLQRGRVRFDVTPDAQRPFVVALRMGEVQVIGTVFTVTDRGGSIQISVTQGHVRWRPETAGGGERTIDLYAGDRLLVRDSQDVVIERGGQSRNALEDGWREGWLVFDNTPLSEAIPMLNAYLDKPLRSADEQVGLLRLTARLRSDDPQALLAALPLVLPVRLDSQSSKQVFLLRMR